MSARRENIAGTGISSVDFRVDSGYSAAQ